MNRLMKNLVLSALMIAAPSIALASSAGADIGHSFESNLSTASLQRGAKLYVNYCMGCHSMQYVRYQSLSDALSITEEQVEENLMFAAEASHEVMSAAIAAEDAARWFGAPPPDLSLVARARGADWLYSYLTTFYVDETRPMGVNNLTLPGASMPHALWELEGFKRAVFRTVEIENADGPPTLREVFDHFEPVTHGEVSVDEYHRAVGDIVNFLVWAGDPTQLERESLGVYVILFLLVLLLFTVLLKKEYWRDVH
jgi:ubiquinol-cytochrome c reductase cytochrome c1 subunit